MCYLKLCNKSFSDNGYKYARCTHFKDITNIIVVIIIIIVVPFGIS